MRWMVDRRLLYNFDAFLLLVTLSIVTVGTVTVYSATFDQAYPGLHPYAWRQAMWCGAGLVATVAMAVFDYRKLERWAWLIYVGGLCLLLAVPLIGSVGGGSRRWISLGGVSLQPSEMMKLAYIVAVARFFHGHAPAGGLRLRDLAVPILLTIPPVVLILQQPDLGTAGVFVCVFASMVLLAGLSRRAILVLVGAAVLTLPAIPVLKSHLKPYQLRRIEIFLDPDLDPLGAGYHITQSKIAIGSGGFRGKGFLNGTQNQLDFLPEQHTDFIFSVYSEEWGFVGGSLLVGLYATLLLRGLVVVNRAKDRFGALLAFGVLSNVFWQAAINLGMTTGLLPVVGITLPFFSYGGSSMLCLLLGVGLAMNVSMRRYFF